MQKHLGRAAVVTAISSLAVVTVCATEGEAAASWQLTVIDDSGDCGQTNEIAFDGTRVRVAWVCESSSGALTVKTAKGPKSGGSFPKVSFGAGSDIDIVAKAGQSAQLTFIDGSGFLRFAREVAAGSGSCGTGNAWDCETVTTYATLDPRIAIGPASKAYISYRTGTTLRYAVRNGINDYDHAIVANGAGGLGAINNFIDGSDATTVPWLAYNIASIAGFTANVKKVGAVANSIACQNTGQCTIKAMAVNAYTHQPSLIAGDQYYRRTDAGTWTHQSYTSTPEWATGLEERAYPCISRGGGNGLVVTCESIFGGWTNTVVDASVEVHTSSITADPATGLHYVAYYDADHERLMLAREIDD